MVAKDAVWRLWQVLVVESHRGLEIQALPFLSAMYMPFEKQLLIILGGLSKRPWRDECGMPSDHASGSMHHELGSNRATKSEEKTRLAALCCKTEVEKLGLSTHRAGRHRKMHGQVALTSMSSTTLGAAPFPQLTSHSTGSIPYGQLMGRRKHQFSLVSGCNCNIAKNWWLLLCSLT